MLNIISYTILFVYKEFLLEQCKNKCFLKTNYKSKTQAFNSTHGIAYLILIIVSDVLQTIITIPIGNNKMIRSEEVDSFEQNARPKIVYKLKSRTFLELNCRIKIVKCLKCVHLRLCLHNNAYMTLITIFLRTINQKYMLLKFFERFVTITLRYKTDKVLVLN